MSRECIIMINGEPVKVVVDALMDEQEVSDTYLKALAIDTYVNRQRELLYRENDIEDAL
jgi:hypothetical protein